MTVRLALALLAFVVASVHEEADAAPAELSGRVAAEHPAACVDYAFVFLDLYRAELWTDSAWLPGEEFALSLVYRRSFDRDDLVDSSISEMARMSDRTEGSLDAARAELEHAMHNVVEGDRYTAWRSGKGHIEFFLNASATGVLTHDADLFLDIWLGSRSRDPDRRDTLLAGRCDD